MARPKGAKNKVSRTAKDNVELVFRAMGGTRGYYEWAMANKDDFYNKHYKTLVPKPIEVSGQDGGPITVNVVKYSDYTITEADKDSE